MAEPAFKLYEISDALQAIGEELLLNGGVLTEELEADLNGLEDAFDKKMERVALYYQQLSRQAEGAKAESKRLYELGQARGNAADRLKEYMLRCLQIANIKKVETDLVRVSRQKNGRPSIHWTRDIEAVPAEFLRIVKEVDGQKAYLALKARGELPVGFEVVTGEHVRVK